MIYMIRLGKNKAHLTNEEWLHLLRTGSIKVEKIRPTFPLTTIQQ